MKIASGNLSSIFGLVGGAAAAVAVAVASRVAPEVPWEEAIAELWSRLLIFSDELSGGLVSEASKAFICPPDQPVIVNVRHPSGSYYCK